MKILINCALFILFSASWSFSQSSKAVNLDDKASKLKNYLDQHQTETVYLHMDKPYYATGDTMYFKAYVLSGPKNLLSSLSSVLYVDLINPESIIVASIKLKINNGLAWGDFALPDSLVSGTFRIRSYTRLMQNHGSESFFDISIPIISTSGKAHTEINLSKPGDNKLLPSTIQFLPESGDLITGARCRVAFEAIAPNGKGTGVNGVVYNSKNVEITEFSSVHLGMGDFYLTPKDGEAYYAKVVFQDGSQSTVKLPSAKSDGLGLSVTSSSTKISVQINPGKDFYQNNQQQTLGLFIFSGGKLTTISFVLEEPDMSFDIQKAGLSSGITQITVLNSSGALLCERLVYIRKNDELNLKVTLDKAIYKTRGHVKVRVEIPAEPSLSTPTHLSVAVVDRGTVAQTGSSRDDIVGYARLKAYLSGYIEKPGYYFAGFDKKRCDDLDLLMLTHGYSQFKWKNVLTLENPTPIYQPERALAISGIATSLNGKPVSGGTVTLIPASGGSLLTTTTNAAGNFSFPNLIFYDTAHFVLSAVTAKGSNNTRIIYRSQPGLVAGERSMEASTDTLTGPMYKYLQTSTKRNEEYLKYHGTGIQLKEVKVRGIRPPNYRTQSLAGAGNADAVITGKQLGNTAFLAEGLIGKVSGLKFSGLSYAGGGVPSLVFGQGPMLVVVDGLLLSAGKGINDINPNDVERIEVLKFGGASIYGVAGGNGVMIITTKQGSGVNVEGIVSTGVLPLTVAGFYRAREFYSPIYEPVNNNVRPDLRTTIYWNPEIVTDKFGRASFDFYNADAAGSYEIIIEGINEDGVPGVGGLLYHVTP